MSGMYLRTFLTIMSLSVLPTWREPVPTFKEAVRKIELEVRDLIVSRPDLSYKIIGNLFDVSEPVIIRIAKQFGIRRVAGRKRKPATSVPKAL